MQGSADLNTRNVTYDDDDDDDDKQCMWNVKTNVLPAIIGVMGTISKSFRKHISNILGNHKVKEMQKTAILGTAHILRKVTM
jgi:hypothetical protein